MWWIISLWTSKACVSVIFQTVQEWVAMSGAECVHTPAGMMWSRAETRWLAPVYQNLILMQQRATFQMLPCKFLYWTRERRSLLCEQNLWNLIHIQLLRSFITPRLTDCAAFPFFLLTLPFPMSRHLSQPGDPGNAFYCNTSILSALSPLLPLLVLSRPAVLSAPEHSGEELLWRHGRGDVSASPAELRAGRFQFICKTYLKSYNKNNVPPELQAALRLLF